MKKLFLLCLIVGALFMGSVPTYAESEDKDIATVSDELDISSETKNVEENGIR